MIFRPAWDLVGLLVFSAVLCAVAFALMGGAQVLGLPVHPGVSFLVAGIVAAVPGYYVSFTIPERRKRERRAHAQAEALATANRPLRNEAKLPNGGRTDFDPHLVFQSGSMVYAIDPDRRLMRVVYGSGLATSHILVPLSMVAAVGAHAKDPGGLCVALHRHRGVGNV